MNYRYYETMINYLHKMCTYSDFELDTRDLDARINFAKELYESGKDPFLRSQYDLECRIKNEMEKEKTMGKEYFRNHCINFKKMLNLFQSIEVNLIIEERLESELLNNLHTPKEEEIKKEIKTIEERLKKIEEEFDSIVYSPIYAKMKQLGLDNDVDNYDVEDLLPENLKSLE